jgi:SAM-dependent methyltransferase
MNANSAAAFAERWFSGRELYGDDFSASDIQRWFADEEHGYADLEGSERESHAYGYHAFNGLHGFSRLPATRQFQHALGFGSNFGDELTPLLPRIERLTLLDASARFVVDTLQGKPVHYVMAQPSGDIAMPSASVDLISALSVLHHIPNVSHVLREFARVLAPGGWLVLREPVTTMGDWRAPRRGLTLRERGIPRAWLLERVRSSGLGVVHVGDGQFPPWVRLCQKLGINAFAHPAWTRIDAVLSQAFAWNARYHRPGIVAKFAPASVFIVAHKALPLS